MNNTEFNNIYIQVKEWAEKCMIITIEEYIEGLSFTKKQRMLIDEQIEQAKTGYNHQNHHTWEEYDAYVNR